MAKFAYAGNTELVVRIGKMIIIEKKEALISAGMAMATQHAVSPEAINSYLDRISEERINEKEKLAKLLKRPNVRLADLVTIDSLASAPAMMSCPRFPTRPGFAGGGGAGAGFTVAAAGAGGGGTGGAGSGVAMTR